MIFGAPLAPLFVLAFVSTLAENTFPTPVTKSAKTKLAGCLGTRGEMQFTLFIILQNSFRSAFWIVELAVLDAPHKGREAYAAQKKCNWNKK